MLKINIKRTAFTFLILAVLSPIALTFQNFRHLDTPMNIDKDETALNDALISALKTAAEERRAKQVALNIETEESAAKPIKRNRKPTAIGDRHEFDQRATNESIAGKSSGEE